MIRRRCPNVWIDRKTRIERGARVSAEPTGAIFIEDSRIGAWSRIHAGRGAELRLDQVSVGPFCVIDSKERIEIGPRSLLAESVSIRDADHALPDSAPLFDYQFDVDPVIIGGNVWLAAKTTVTRGVTIVADVVVGANSVVTRPITSPGSYAGAPARRLQSSDPASAAAPAEEDSAT